MDQTACEGCPSQPLFVHPWVRHILGLDALVQAGCRFGLDDLDIDEWEGLKLLNSERARHESKKMKEIERQHG